MNIKLKTISLFIVILFICGCMQNTSRTFIQDVNESMPYDPDQIWLSHEHILVDFIGADSIDRHSWELDSVLEVILPFFEELKSLNVHYFVDATPAYLGRDVQLLKKIADTTGIRIITNTGFYGARDNKFVPDFVEGLTAEELSRIWIREYREGIDGTSIKPGFIKIGIDNDDPLHPLHQKLVSAAALTHLETGLTIASHTGKAKGLWPQLEILRETGISPQSFIWVHAQNETDNNLYLKAAEMGCWISLDGLGWDIDRHLEKILFAKRNGFLDQILISHDAGWYDPQKSEQSIKPFTNIFHNLYPELKANGFTDEEFNLLIRVNPANAFAIRVRKD